MREDVGSSGRLGKLNGRLEWQVVIILSGGVYLIVIEKTHSFLPTIFFYHQIGIWLLIIRKGPYSINHGDGAFLFLDVI